MWRTVLWAVTGMLTSMLCIPSIGVAQQVVRYDLYITDTVVNFGGKNRHAIATNGQIPMPTLEFFQGDTAEVVVHNQLHENTSLHWHGVQLPNREDGVPFLTQMPIPPQGSYTYRFPVTQNGTYWYHSHSGFQEQIGMYGALVFRKKTDDPTFRKEIDDLPTVPIVLSEWTNLNPHEVQRLLATGNDWFDVKKNTVQSYFEAIRAGHLKTKLTNEWKRMEAMDVSDIYYDRFLVNGQHHSQLSQFKAGQKVRLRVINAGGSSYFWLNYAGGKMSVTASDGNDVEPVSVDRLIIGVSETYDVVVEIPEENTSYQFLATAEDRSGSAYVFIGDGKQKKHLPLPRLLYFEGMKMMNGMMKMNGDLDDRGMDMSLQRMDMNTVMYPESAVHSEHQHGEHPVPKDTAHHKEHHHHHISADSHHVQNPHGSDVVTLNYAMLKATHKTNLPSGAPIKELRFELTGNMNRYVWSMDNRVLSETDKIPVKKGEVLRITLYNNSMMRHPMHLHGFDFRIINGQGDYSPLKNVMDIMPMETNVIEFEANREGDWFFHCHILYHMMAGMNRVFSVGHYENPLIPDREKAFRTLQKESNMGHFMIENDVATNGNDGTAMWQNTRWQATAEWRLGYHGRHGYEVETHVGRYIGKMQWLMPFVGFDWRYRRSDRAERNLFGQANTKDSRTAVSIGVMYTLPMLVNLQAEVYHDGIARLSLAREDIPVSKRFRAGFMVNTDKEYMGELRYILTRHLGMRTHYDSDMGFGLGLWLRY